LAKVTYDWISSTQDVYSLNLTLNTKHLQAVKSQWDITLLFLWRLWRHSIS